MTANHPIELHGYSRRIQWQNKRYTTTRTIHLSAKETNWTIVNYNNNNLYLSFLSKCNFAQDCSFDVQLWGITLYLYMCIY